MDKRSIHFDTKREIDGNNFCIVYTTHSHFVSCIIMAIDSWQLQMDKRIHFITKESEIDSNNFCIVHTTYSHFL